jgi:hypothetical protein
MPDRSEGPYVATFASLALLLVLAFIAPGPLTTAAMAQSAEPSKPPKLFTRDDTLEVVMKAPWGDVQKRESYQGTYPAQLQYQASDGSTVTVDMTVGRRGVKRQELCDFPPIRLKFEKKAVKGTVFRGQKSLKMVTHCKRSTRYDQYYVVEMLAYQMYNLLTDYSFRVRPLQVTYVDSSSGKADDPRFAFLIEDDSDVAKRNGLKKVEIPRIKPSRLDPTVTSLMSVFQYLIGNTDWAALRGPDPKECCHNIQLIGPEPLGSDDFVVPVPYDFDSSGLVDARYAAPHEALPIRSVTDRLYRGYCMHNETLESARQQMLRQEAAIKGLVEDESRLRSSLKKKSRRYLEDFFDIMEDPDEFKKNITEQCRR